MKQFTDCKNRTWDIDVQTASIKRVRRLLGVDLMDVVSPTSNLFESLFRDPVAIGDVAYAVCQPQAEARGIDQDEFLSALSGDCIAQARDILIESLSDFFPDAAMRAAMKRVLVVLRKQMKQHEEQATARLENGELERQMEAELAQDGVSSGAVPASSA